MRKIWWALPLFLTLVFTSGNAQFADNEGFREDSLLAVRYFNIADSFYLDFEKCLKYSALAIPLLKKTNQDSLYVSCLLGLSYVYNKKEDYEKMEENNLIALEEAERLFGPNHELYGFALNNLYYIYSTVKEDYTKSRNAYLKALQLLDEGKSSNTILAKAGICQNLGYIFQKEGDYESALNYFNQSFRYYIQRIDQSGESADTYLNLALVKNNIGRVHYNRKDYGQAIENIKEAIEIAQRNPHTDKTFFIGYYTFLSRIYLDKGEPEYARLFLKKIDQYRPFSELELAKVYKLEGRLLSLSGNLSDAILKIKQAIKTMPDEKTVDIAELYMLIGEIYSSAKNYASSIEAYQKTLALLTLDSLVLEGYENPPIEARFRAKAIFTKAILDKATTLNHWYKSSNQLDYLERALATFVLASHLTDRLRQDYQSEKSKLFLGSKAADFYEEAIAAAKTLYEQTSNAVYLDQAFFFMEKSKSAILLDELRMKKVRIIPDAVRMKVRQFKVELNYLEKKLQVEENKLLPDRDKLQQIENEIFTIKQDKLYFTDSLNFSYPNYYRLQGEQVLSFKVTRKKLLSDNQVFIEYFVGKDKIYALKISKEEARLIDLDYDVHLSTLVNTLLVNLRLNGKHSLNDFSSAAAMLYQKLIQPLGLTPGEKLIIVPDGMLGSLPFEILLKRRRPGELPKAMHFLMRNHQISYAYSATLLDLQNNPPDHPFRTLGIFPTFANSELFLPNSAQEMGFLKKIDACLLPGKEANVANFRDTMAHFDLIHLSTHAVAEDSMFKQPAFYLSDSIFYLSDLYTLNIPAQLVVMSACETGLGQQQNGEGMMSLSRGFTYAGVPSLITTLWKVSDRTTADILGGFYENLSSGMSKDKALHQAKIDYLDQCAAAKSAPYYWAGFIQIGNSGSVKFSHPPNYLPWLTIPLLISLIFVAIKLSKKE